MRRVFAMSSWRHCRPHSGPAMARNDRMDACVYASPTPALLALPCPQAARRPRRRRGNGRDAATAHQRVRRGTTVAHRRDPRARRDQRITVMPRQGGRPKACRHHRDAGRLGRPGTTRLTRRGQRRVWNGASSFDQPRGMAVFTEVVRRPTAAAFGTARQLGAVSAEAAPPGIENTNYFADTSEGPLRAPVFERLASSSCRSTCADEAPRRSARHPGAGPAADASGV